MRLEGGGFLVKGPRFIYLLRFSSPLAVEEDTVQAAVMPPAPGSVLVMMRSLNVFDGVFAEIFMVDTRLVDSPMRLPFSSSPNLCPRCIVRRFPPCETLGTLRCWFLTI